MKTAFMLTRRMRIALMGAAFLTAAAGVGQAATVRGRTGCAVTRGPSRPATGYYFTVFNARIGRSKPAPVGADGAFYLYNIPPGSYVLEAWSKANPTVAPKVFQLTVYGPYTDVPQIVLGC